MADARAIRRYRRLYSTLLRLYPKAFRDRFAEGMQQTFQDLCRERQADGRALPWIVLGLFAETCNGILRERIEPMIPSRTSVLRLAAITASILAIPLVAMQFSDDVDWSFGDFIGAGVLVFGTGMAFLAIASNARNSAYRAATGLGLATAFFVVWVNLAVGIIGSDDNPANVLYLAVLIVGGVGASVARLRPSGMARAMFAVGVAQFLVPFTALLIWQPLIDSEAMVADLIRVFFLNTILALMFIGSGALFRQASAEGSPS